MLTGLLQSSLILRKSRGWSFSMLISMCVMGKEGYRG